MGWSPVPGTVSGPLLPKVKSPLNCSVDCSLVTSWARYIINGLIRSDVKHATLLWADQIECWLQSPACFVLLQKLLEFCFWKGFCNRQDGYGSKFHFFKGENLPKGNTIVWKGNILSQFFSHFQKQVSNCDRKLVFLGRREVSFMPAGYTFKSSLVKTHQLRWNLSRDACHSSFMQNWKKHQKLGSNR
jgi:hypothetical protein